MGRVHIDCHCAIPFDTMLIQPHAAFASRINFAQRNSQNSIQFALAQVTWNLIALLHPRLIIKNKSKPPRATQKSLKMASCCGINRSGSCSLICTKLCLFSLDKISTRLELCLCYQFRAQATSLGLSRSLYGQDSPVTSEKSKLKLQY